MLTFALLPNKMYTHDDNKCQGMPQRCTCMSSQTLPIKCLDKFTVFEASNFNCSTLLSKLTLRTVTR